MGVLKLFYLDFDNKAQNKIYCLNMRRRLLNDICGIEFVDKIDTIAGDVCIVDNNTLDKYFITPDSIKCINQNKHTPIGAVVVPASHTNDGTTRISSLSFMNYRNPNSGSLYGSIRIYYGGSYDIPNLQNLNYIPYIADSGNSISFPQTLMG